MKISDKAASCPSSGIRAMTVMASKYENVLSFGLGEPDFVTPQHIIDSACEALNNGYTKYVAVQGIPLFLEAIKNKMHSFNNMNWVTEDNIHVAFGAGQGIFLTMQTLINPGDEVIVPIPCFPNYFGYVHMAGGVVVPVDTYEENGFRVTAQDIEKKITSKTRMIMINSPCNPTGAVLTPDDIKAIADLAMKHNIIVLSDEPYEAIVFDGQNTMSIGSIPGMEDLTVTVNSLSKSYAMTGWRVGYVVAPSNVRQKMTLLQENMGSNIASAYEVAGATALNGAQDSVEAMAREYEKRRNILVDGLNELKGWSCVKPGGAFYVFPNIKSFGMTSYDLAVKILQEAKVLTTPGSAFGDCGEGYLRFSYASSEQNIRAALERLKTMFGTK